jgi:hypothetical protein
LPICLPCLQVPPEVVERVFASVTRTNTDGRLSVRDLRQWYITFGKRAMREGLGADEIVSVAFVRSSGAAAVTARKEALLHERKRGVVDMIASGTLPAGFAAGGATGSASERGLGASGVGGAAATGSPSASRGVPGLPGLHGEAGGTALPAGPLTLPNGMLEFQVRACAAGGGRVRRGRLRGASVRGKAAKGTSAGAGCGGRLRGLDGQEVGCSDDDDVTAGTRRHIPFPWRYRLRPWTRCRWILRSQQLQAEAPLSWRRAHVAALRSQGSSRTH